MSNTILKTVSILSLAFFLSFNSSKAQCGMSSYCASACILCDLDGFSSTVSGPLLGQMPPGFCTAVQHHVQWVGFIAGSANLTISVGVFNCTRSSGLEMGIYESTDCSSFALVSNCNTAMFDGQTWSFSNTVPLIPGNTYYLVFDGNGPNRCDFSVNVSSGTTQAPPIDGTADIAGPRRVCRGANQSYSSTPVTGASRHVWYWDGAPIGQGLQVDPPLSVPGMHRLCIEPSNRCNAGQQTCIDVEVYNIEPTYIKDSVCVGDCYDFLGNTYCAPGVYTKVIPTFLGCDSTIILTLEPMLPASSSTSDTICRGDTLWVQNQPLTTPNVYQFTFPTSGCDSTAFIELYVENNEHATIADTLCYGNVLTVGDSTFDKSGNYSVAIPRGSDCDSIVEVSLIIKPQAMDSLAGSYCTGESFEIGDSSFSDPGWHEVWYQRQGTCDSVVYLFLEELPVVETILDKNICAGEVFQIGDSLYRESGYYETSLLTVSGCDSIVRLNLQVDNIITTNLQREICAGETFAVGDSLYSSSGSYTYPLTAVSGCDSIVELALTVLPKIENNLRQTICRGEVVHIGNQTFSENGSYTVSLQGAAGCDSIVSLDLSILELDSVYIFPEICAGETYRLDAYTFDAPGDYEVHLSNSAGCDSTVYVALRVHSVFNSVINPVLCAGEVYTIGGGDYTTAGTYSLHLQTSNGCDSIIQLNLTFRDTIFTNIKTEICTGQSYRVGGNSFTSSGNYRIPLQSAAGCDSVVLLALDVVDAFETTVSAGICAGEIYTLAGRDFNSSGYYEIPLLSSAGCDSLVHLELLVHEQKDTTIRQRICQGDTIRINNSSFNESGNYQINTLSGQGCDSIIHLALEVVAPQSHFLNIDICEGSDYLVGNEVFTSTGNYQVVMATQEGCDSIIHLDLNVISPVDTSIRRSACVGETVRVGGQLFSNPGDYEITIPAITGCDSTIYLRLDYLQPQFSQLNAEICEGDSLVIENQIFKSPGTYDIFLMAANGCDSILSLDLVVLETPTSNLAVTICDGDSYTFDNQVYDSQGIYDIYLTGNSGCDSLVRLALMVEDCSMQYDLQVTNPRCYGGTGSISLLLTAGKSPFDISWVGENHLGDTTITGLGDTLRIENLPEGEYSFTIVDVNDQAVNFIRSIAAPPPLEVSQTISQFGDFNLRCHDSNDGEIEVRAAGGTPDYRIEWNDGINNFFRTNAGPGFYTYQVFDNNGCVASDSLQLTAPARISSDFEILQPHCRDEYSGEIHPFHIAGGSGHYSFFVNQIHYETGAENMPPGIYQLEITDEFGCSVDTSITLEAPKYPTVELGPELQIQSGDSIQLSPQTTTAISKVTWEYSQYISCTDCLYPYVRPQTITYYTLHIENEAGCTASDSVLVRVRPNQTVYIPSAFSPNFDGINDIFTFYGGANVHRVRSMKIFDRWGELMFEAYDFAPNQEANGWDGTFKNKPLNAGVYIYLIEVEFYSGRRATFYGDVTLMR